MAVGCAFEFLSVFSVCFVVSVVLPLLRCVSRCFSTSPFLLVRSRSRWRSWVPFSDRVSRWRERCLDWVLSFVWSLPGEELVGELAVGLLLLVSDWAQTAPVSPTVRLAINASWVIFMVVETFKKETYSVARMDGSLNRIG